MKKIEVEREIIVMGVKEAELKQKEGYQLLSVKNTPEGKQFKFGGKK